MAIMEEGVYMADRDFRIYFLADAVFPTRGNLKGKVVSRVSEKKMVVFFFLLEMADGRTPQTATALQHTDRRRTRPRQRQGFTCFLVCVCLSLCSCSVDAGLQDVVRPRFLMFDLIALAGRKVGVEVNYRDRLALLNVGFCVIVFFLVRYDLSFVM